MYKILFRSTEGYSEMLTMLLGAVKRRCWTGMDPNYCLFRVALRQPKRSLIALAYTSVAASAFVGSDKETVIHTYTQKTKSLLWYTYLHIYKIIIPSFVVDVKYPKPFSNLSLLYFGCQNPI